MERKKRRYIKMNQRACARGAGRKASEKTKVEKRKQFSFIYSYPLLFIFHSSSHPSVAAHVPEFMVSPEPPAISHCRLAWRARSEYIFPFFALRSQTSAPARTHRRHTRLHSSRRSICISRDAWRMARLRDDRVMSAAVCESM